MSFRALSLETRRALATCVPYGNKGRPLENTEAILAFWRKKHKRSEAFLNLKELTPQMVREIREKILDPYSGST